MMKCNESVEALKKEIEEAYRSVTILTNELESKTEQLRNKIQQLEEANQTITEQQGQLLEKEQLKVVVQMAGVAAHELGQPMTVALGYSQLLRARDDCPDNLRRPLEKIDKSVEKMKNILLRMQSVQNYETKPYVGDSSIVDLGYS